MTRVGLGITEHKWAKLVGMNIDMEACLRIRLGNQWVKTNWKGNKNNVNLQIIFKCQGK